MPKRTKAFIAIEMPKVVQKKCLQIQVELANDFPGVKWTKPDSLHITLLFLGEIDDKQLWQACDLAKKACADIDPFHFKLHGLGCFPNPRRPRVIWLGIDPDSGSYFKQLHKEIGSKISDTGFYRMDQKEFQPHLSIGRINQQDLDFSVVCSRWKVHPWTSDDIDVNQVLVMSSESIGDEHRYTKLAKIKL